MKTMLPTAIEFISGVLIFLKADKNSTLSDEHIQNQNSLSLK